MAATITAYPFDGQSTTEDQYGAIMALFQDPGVEGAPGSAGLQVSANGSGMAVQVNDGVGFHSGYRAALTGGPASVTVSASGGADRTDRVVLRIDPATNSATLMVLKVADAAGPYDVLLAYVLVPAGSVVVSGGNVTDARQFMGFRVGIWATRPTGRNAMGYNTALGRWEYTVDQGTTWTPLGLQVIVADTIPGTVTPGALLLVRS